MKKINYLQVPSNQNDDSNKGLTFWKDGNCVGIDEGTHRVVYLGHKKSKITDENGEELEVTFAFPVRIEKPVTRDKAINAAEMEAYDLKSPMDVASFGTSLSRKFRENENDDEVKEHDEFIAWVKEGLTKVGL